jgi:MSHA biogenesis protein MshK
MDQAVMAPRTMLVAAVVALGALAGGARAQALQDPTRPPPMPTKAVAGARAAAVAAPAGPVLQSVLIARQAGGRQVAVIDGETVVLGGTFRGALLVRMTETEVELRRGSTRQVLKLFAGAGHQAAPAVQR